jgi:hypothetical protein
VLKQNLYPKAKKHWVLRPKGQFHKEDKLEPIERVSFKDCRFWECLNDLPEEEREEILMKRKIYKLREGGW